MKARLRRENKCNFELCVVIKYKESSAPLVSGVKYLQIDLIGGGDKACSPVGIKENKHSTLCTSHTFKDPSCPPLRMRDSSIQSAELTYEVWPLNSCRIR